MYTVPRTSLFDRIILLTISSFLAPLIIPLSPEGCKEVGRREDMEARTLLLCGLLGSVYVTGDEIDDIEGSNRQLGARTKDGGGSALVQKLVILNKKNLVFDNVIILT